MLTVAYLANQFPSAVEPYVSEEIEELRRCGIRVIAGSARKTGRQDKAFAATDAPEIVLQPLRAVVLLRAAWLCALKWKAISPFVVRIMLRGKEGLLQRIKATAHTLLGACYVVLLQGRG